MKRCTLPLVFLITTAATPISMAAFNTATPSTPAAAAAPIQVKVWTWLIKIQNMDYPNDELTADMFVTFTYDLEFKEKVNPMTHF
ncbi:MAG: hypothetical protein WCJ35_11860 [Planctomycetota bacterium]